MDEQEFDPVTGRKTTGHEWNGIKELDTPIPRVVLFFLAAGTLFSLIWWVLMPAWPLGVTYTKGLLGLDQRDVVMREVQVAAAERSVWTDRLATADFAEIAADPQMMAYVRQTGGVLFTDNCAVCHGVGGAGGPGYPALTAGAWLWGGDPESLAETIRVGVNAQHRETRVSEMLAFGDMKILTHDQIMGVAGHVRTLSGQKPEYVDAAALIAGQQTFADQCAVCHGADGRGNASVGAPNLKDRQWLYGGDTQSIVTSIQSGRHGQMPAWEGRLSPAEIRMMAVYVADLAKDKR
jgi:cytochrome c oxidase cbb3-type subunit 3